MYKLDIDSIEISGDQICDYSPFSILIYDTRELNEIADKRQKENGNPTFFDESNPNNDDNGWYDFFFDTDGEKIIQFYYEDYCGKYIDYIEITEEDKQLVMQKIIDYYGGKEEYKKICEEYWT